MDKPVVSIIMPVYNTEKYVGEAIRSVLAQDYPHWELWAVDDGSADGSGGVLDEYARQDFRIQVIHTENGGVSRARNLALEKARGEYICFLDSDDCYEPNYLSTLLSWTNEAGPIPCCCGFTEEREGGSSAPARPMEHKRVSVDTFLYEAFMGSLALPLCCWTWLLPRERARSVRFEEGLSYGEDSLYICRQLQSWEEIYYDPKPLYRYRMDRQGNTVTELSLKKAESQFRSVGNMWKLYKGSEGKARQAMTKYLVECAAAAARAAYKEKEKNKGNAYQRKALRLWKRLKACEAISSKDKLRLLFYSLAPRGSEWTMQRRYGRV